MTDLPRRAAIRQILQSVAVLVVAPAGARTAFAADSCADPASASLRASMNYAAVSSDPARTCGGCAFYARDESLQACGACTIMSGPVDEGGICDSWAERSA